MDALVRFGFSDLNQVDLSFSPLRSAGNPLDRVPTFACSVCSFSSFSRFFPRSFLHLILSLGPSIFFLPFVERRACDGTLFARPFPFFFGVVVSICTQTRGEHERMTRFVRDRHRKRARRNRSTKCSYRDQVAHCRTGEAEVGLGGRLIPPRPVFSLRTSHTGRSIYSDLLTVRFFKFGRDKPCRFLFACLAFVKLVCVLRTNGSTWVL